MVEKMERGMDGEREREGERHGWRWMERWVQRKARAPGKVSKCCLPLLLPGHEEKCYLYASRTCLDTCGPAFLRHQLSQHKSSSPLCPEQV